MKLFHRHNSRADARAFTIIEIAICLGIIAFALVAIIAALPSGLSVQKRNREETIVTQDAGVWMSALRSGALGYDDLTNYVDCITNFWTKYDVNYNVIDSGSDYYTPSNSKVTSITPVLTDFPLTNGARIIGLLSMPKFMPNSITPPYQSNYVVAYVRGFSGSEVEKPPQTNGTVLGDAFTYRMIVENFPYVPVDTNAFSMSGPATNGLTADQMAARTNLAYLEWMLRTNSNDFRLRFRWPVLPNGQIGSYGAATFSAIASGPLVQTNDGGEPKQPLYFVQPSIYVQRNPNLNP